MNGTRFTLEVHPTLPTRLRRLKELANDLFYSWDREVRALFYRLDSKLWEACRHNPKVFLRRVSQARLDEAALDPIFLEDYGRVLSSYDSYHQERIRPDVRRLLDPDKDLVAYFCAEFGFHESFQIYSGGLGILAGDHCKAASDLGIPFVGVGLLYRQGYFTQTIDGHGRQVAHYMPTNFDDLPIVPAVDAEGQAVHVQIELPGRIVRLRVWRAKAGHITLYLLDSDLPENAEADRSITYQLYGGDTNTRMQQEIALGIGGVRALRALGLMPTVWHINEGHSAFQILERCRERVKTGLEFDAAIELVASTTIFTTHTPVPAGHDIFEHKLAESYFADFMRELGIGREQFLSLGASPNSDAGFNMTALALRGSRFRNGVSRIHRGVAARMTSFIWPEVPHEENPMDYVTNGVHVPTFLAREWANLFDMRFGSGWRSELVNRDFWQRIDEIPGHSYWSLRQSLKTDMMADVRRRIVLQYRRNNHSEAVIERATKHLQPREADVLTIGFARRFATYKRAGLLFSDPQRLARLLNDPQRPVVLIFAGKAHPLDRPAQHLIQLIHDFSRRPEFEGKLILIEGYDLALARKLVKGVDVWLNTPEYPLEASGTSGEKAGINGVLNLSVLDGWWGEGYDGENGWAISPRTQLDAAARDRDEAQELLDIIEKEVIPLYYQRNGYGYPEAWVDKSKKSMKSLMPSFNAQRMMMDYIQRYYAAARRQRAIMMENEYARAREVAEWKKKVHRAWPQVRMRRLDTPMQEVGTGNAVPIRVAVHLNGLEPDDVLMRCLVGTEAENGDLVVHDSYVFTPEDRSEAGETVFKLDLQPRLPGLQYYKIRLYPFHPTLPHQFEMGYMLWL